MSSFSLRHLSNQFARALIAVTLLVGGSMFANAAPKVVASIKPLHGLVAIVMEGAGQPELLLDGVSSPHDFALKPSQAVLLNQADLVFWIGHELETALEKSLGSLSGGSTIVSILDVDGMILHHYRDADDFSIDAEIAHASGHADHNEHDDHEKHEEHADGSDPHIWLDPRNAVIALDAIAKALAGRDPENADLYRTNASAAKSKMAALETEIAGLLDENSIAKFVLYHDGFQYFEKRFGLQALGVILLNSETMPGASQISAVRNLIAAEDVSCVFTEPQFSPKLAATVTESTNAKTYLVDPLGVDLMVGADMYFELLRNIAKSYADCLSSTSD